MTHQTHAYHIVNPSPWPLTGALSALLITSGLAIWFHYNSTLLLTLGITTNLLTIYQWWRDIIRESTFQGHHTPIVQKGLRYGIILFIISEVFFFAGFFWAFYHSSLAPTPELGGCWPPTGIIPLNPLEVPLLNTSVLLASGVSITWAHHSLMEGNRKHMLQALFITISLGVYFTLLQASEYYETSFTISDGVYGSTFFMATGFHGLHVIIGSTFLIVCFLRQLKYHFTSNHHFGFEAAAWYWHFVDVVWLFLYVSIYWWGSYSFSINKYSWLPINQFRYNPKRNNKCNTCLTYQYTPVHTTCTHRILITPTKHLCRKSKPLWVRIWSYRVRPPTFLHKILLGSHYILAIWPRNCTTTPPSLSLTNRQTTNHTHYSPSTNLITSRKPSLRMNPKRTRMNWIW